MYGRHVSSCRYIKFYLWVKVSSIQHAEQLMKDEYEYVALESITTINTVELAQTLQNIQPFTYKKPKDNDQNRNKNPDR